MKQFFLKGLFLGILSFLGIKSFAYDCEVDGIYYNLNNTNNTASVTYKSIFSTYSYKGSVTIPSSIVYNGITYIVKSIGNYAFMSSSLTSVTIPNSVTTIGSMAFCECSNLVTVVIPNSVTSVDSQAFEECYSLQAVYISDITAWCNISFSGGGSTPLSYAHHLFLNGIEVKDLVIPNNVTSIGWFAFFGLSELTSVTIPYSVKSIGGFAFCGCKSLTSITIPNGVTSIEEETFCGCSGLTSVTIPNSVNSIGVSAFDGCKSLTSITIPNSVTSIGEYAFYSCI